jgi:hypothetical protein
MSIQDTLQKELSPAEVLGIKHQKAVKLITTRALELVEQYQKTPDVLIELAKTIEGLEPLPLVPELPAETPFPTEALSGMDSAVFERCRIAGELLEVGDPVHGLLLFFTKEPAMLYHFPKVFEPSGRFLCNCSRSCWSCHCEGAERPKQSPSF